MHFMVNQTIIANYGLSWVWGVDKMAYLTVVQT